MACLYHSLGNGSVSCWKRTIAGYFNPNFHANCKEEWREQGWSEEDITRGLKEAQRAFATQEIRTEIGGIKKALSESSGKAKIAELKAVDTALEPLVKYGDEAREEKTCLVQTWKRRAVDPANQNETHFA